MFTKRCFFDVDGTLVDSNDAHAHAWVEAHRRERQARGVFCASARSSAWAADKLLPALTGIPDRFAGRKVDRGLGAARSSAATILPHLQPTRGAQRLLEWLRDDRLAAGCGDSSAEDDELEGLLEVAGAARLFDRPRAPPTMPNDRSPIPTSCMRRIKQANCPVAKHLHAATRRTTSPPAAICRRRGHRAALRRLVGSRVPRRRRDLRRSGRPGRATTSCRPSSGLSLVVEVAAHRFEADPLALPQRRPQIARLLQPRRHRSDGERLAVDAVVHLLPGERRRDAGELAGARAVGGRQRLAEDVLQEVDVDALAARGDRALDRRAASGCFCATTVATIWQKSRPASYGVPGGSGM